MAHEKIRPLQAIKSGANGGDIPLADYDNDYPLFVFSQIDDNDARDALTADYYVRMTEGPPLRFEKVPGMPNEELAPEYRAGLITTRWFFVINTMFTPLPRTTAAQAYRAYLGLDIAKSEGLIEPADEVLVDLTKRVSPMRRVPYATELWIHSLIRFPDITVSSDWVARAL